MVKLETTYWVDLYGPDGNPIRAIIDVSPTTSLSLNHSFTYRVRKEFGDHALFHSALKEEGAEDIMRQILSRKRISVALELGTFKGITTALIAHYADKVITLDRDLILAAKIIWERFGVKDKIEFGHVPTNDIKLKVIENLHFDFAFIDDQHDYEGAEMGFEATERCGRILFHDYCDEFPGVKKFIDTLPRENLTITDKFALWEKR